MSQSPEHQHQQFRLQSRFFAWVARSKQDHLLVGCEMACRWDQAFPKVGVDPDVFIVMRPPPDNERGYPRSLRTWADGHVPPLLAIEIVSESRPQKDYVSSPERHDLLGTFELWIFDPCLYGRSPEQPSVLLQVFKRETHNRLTKVHAGAGPFYSDALDAWVMVVDGDIVVAYDREGKDRWPTLEEAAQWEADEERAAKEAALRKADEERAAKEAAQRQTDEERAAREAAQRQTDAERAAREAAQRQTDEERAAREAAQRQIDAERAAREAAQRQTDAERAAREAAQRQIDAERAAKEAAQRQIDEERAAKEAALARVAEFEALLARQK